MVSRIREQLGTAGLIVAVVALVAALAGGAYAASGGLSGKQKKEVTKIAEKYAGKQGPAGPPGSPGANGKDGSNGAAGKDGAAGALGPAGTNGKSVVVGGATPAECPEGGATVGVEGSATKKPICNGAEGAPGVDGLPGPPGPPGPEGVCSTPSCHLPSGVTETGSFYIKGEGKEEQTAPIGWSIPLTPAAAALITEVKIHVVGAGGGGVCTGTAKLPAAPTGHLCFYKALGSGTLFTGAFPVIELAPFNVEKEEFPNYAAGAAGVLAYSEASTWSTSSWVQGSFALTAP